MAEERTLPECLCLRCSWKWIPRIPDPKICPNPKCHSVYWDIPRKEKGNGNKGETNE